MKKLIFIILFIFTACEEKKNNSLSFLKTYPIFQDNMIHFSTEDTVKTKYETVRVGSMDDGREIITQVELPTIGDNVRIKAKVTLRPIPKDLLSVYDKWDRAGHIRLVRDDSVDVEIMKFMTAYGGKTDWEVDVTHLASLLNGSCTFIGWIDTWVSPGWRMDFELVYESSQVETPHWIKPVFYNNSYEKENPGEVGLVNDINIPNGLSKVEFYYLVSGHCTDGRGADEFEPKDNVIFIDNKEVHRFRPWRTDCKQFRAINPYTRRWSNGDWSSDFDRTNWCPGDVVEPIKFDFTQYLTEGNHNLNLIINNARPRDKNGHLGYWRVSAYLVGWE